MNEDWQHFPHAADIGIRGRGATMAAAFEQAALALFAAVTEVGAVAPSVRVEIACDAPNAEILLVDWLNALIFEASVRKMLFSRFAVAIAGGRLTGTAWGEAIDCNRHVVVVEPKGATLTALRVGQDADGRWSAQCVVDV